MPLFSHPRDTRLSFDPIAHIYRVDGTQVPWSVTSLVTKFERQPFDADAQARRLTGKGTGEYAGMSADEIKASWTRRADLGTFMHEKLEDWTNGKPVSLRMEGAVDVDVAAGMVALRSLCQTLNAAPVAAEWRVWHDDGVAGTIDAVLLGEMGELHIVDWKRKKMPEGKWDKGYRQMLPPIDHLWDSPSTTIGLQLNAYRHIVERMYEMPVKTMWAVILHPENSAPILTKQIQRIDMDNVFASVESGSSPQSAQP